MESQWPKTCALRRKLAKYFVKIWELPFVPALKLLSGGLEFHFENGAYFVKGVHSDLCIPDTFNTEKVLCVPPHKLIYLALHFVLWFNPLIAVGHIERCLFENQGNVFWKGIWDNLNVLVSSPHLISISAQCKRTDLLEIVWCADVILSRRLGDVSAVDAFLSQCIDGVWDIDSKSEFGRIFADIVHRGQIIVVKRGGSQHPSFVLDKVQAFTLSLRDKILIVLILLVGEEYNWVSHGIPDTAPEQFKRAIEYFPEACGVYTALGHSQLRGFFALEFRESR